MMPSPQLATPSSGPHDTTPVLFMGLALAVFGVFAVAGMGHPFALDESCSILKGQLSFEGLVAYLKSDGHTPLYYLLLNGWLGAFGLSEMSARTLSLLCQSGTAVLLLVHGRLVLRSAWAGAFAGTLFLLGKAAMKTALQVKMYPLMALFTVLSILSAQLAVGTGKKRYFGLIALTVCAASFTNSMAFYIVIGLTAASALYGRVAWLRVTASCLTGLVPYVLLWLPIAAGQAHNGSIDWIRPSTPLAPLRDIYNFFSPGTLALPVIALAAAGSGGFAPWRRITILGRAIASTLRDRHTLFTVVMFVTSFGAFCATSFLVKPLLGVLRYEIIFIPMLTISVGALFSNLAKPRLSAILLGGLLILCLIPYPSNPRYPAHALSRQYVTSVAHSLAGRLEPGDVIVSVGLSYLPLKLYLGFQSPPHHILLALPRDVETHPGWSRYIKHGRQPEVPDDMPRQWENVYDIIRREKPGHVFVLNKEDPINDWFVDRFMEHMALTEHQKIDSRSWSITDLYVFSPSEKE